MIQQPVKINTKNAPAEQKTHHVRTFFASLFGLAALFLIFASIVTVWLNQTLTNPQLFVSTLAPLANQPDVQNFIAVKATDALLTNAPTADVAMALLPVSKVAGQPVSQLRAELQPVINQSMLQVVDTPQFAALWKSTLQSAHMQFMTQLNSDAPDVTLDLRPAITGAIDLFGATKLRIVSNKITLGTDSGTIHIKGAMLRKIRVYYRLFQEGTIGIIALAVIAAVLCVVISVQHIRTLRRILLGTGIIALVLALALTAPSLIASSSGSLQQKATTAIIHTLFHNLQLASLILGVTCIVLAVGSKAYAKLRARAK